MSTRAHPKIFRSARPRFRVIRLAVWAALPFARLLTFIATVLIVVSAVTYRRAAAQLDEIMLQMGDGLMEYSAARHQDEPRGIVFNGQRLFMRSGTTDDPVSTVLDHYQGMCRLRDGQLLQQLLSTTGLPSLPDGVEPGFLEPTRRHESDGSGYVACLDTGSSEPLGLSELTERLQAFSESGDLADVGDLRYAYVRRGRDHTHFMVFWTRGSFNVRQMFPEHGDAPGRDVPGIARPEGSRRILSTWEDGVGQSVTMYEGGDGDEAALLAHYREELPAQGWTVLSRPEALPDVYRTQPLGECLAVEHGQRMAFLVFTREPGQPPVTTILDNTTPLPGRAP